MNRGLRLILVVLAIAWGDAGRAAPITDASPEQLAAWLREYPEADADRDGRLTVEEAETYRQELEAENARTARPDYPHEFTFATMSDGVRIALAVAYPAEFDRGDRTRKWPAIFSICGYPSATVPLDPARFGGRYVTVNASLRGTGASGGAIGPWLPRSWQDGYEIIENWIAGQPWANGRVGIIGHSWPGLMGFLTATTNPPSLKAVCVSGLIDDFYRGIAFPGGIRNSGFPVEWLSNFYRPDGVFGSDAAARLARGMDEAMFREIIAARPARDLAHDMLWLSLHERFDTAAVREQSLASHAAKIRAPILIGHTWQDEQTGPTGWQLWKRIAPGVPKRLCLSNGHHGAMPLKHEDAVAWFDRWLLDEREASLPEDEKRVACYFETRAPGNQPQSFGPPLLASEFPLPDTRWTRLYLRSGNRLDSAPPSAGESPDMYQVGAGDVPRGNERVHYLFEFGEATAVCGPIAVDLWAELSTIDTDFFVLLADLAPGGKAFGLQRGLLRASHRKLDESRSEFVDTDGGRRLLVRPFHPHDQAEPVPPRTPVEYHIEIPAVGHVFRPGHRLALVICRPPRGDPIGITRHGGPSYQYDSAPPEGTVTVRHDAEYASSVLLPVIPRQVSPSAAVPLEEQAGIQPIIQVAN